uniref:TetR family transcriptional regulator n=1 Tax=Ferrovibrio terrae TaxID=2594003 RepID=UPI003137F011
MTKKLKALAPQLPAARTPARRGRPRSLETETAILEAAYRLAASQGLTATTVDAIARDSQVS